MSTINSDEMFYVGNVFYGSVWKYQGFFRRFFIFSTLEYSYSFLPSNFPLNHSTNSSIISCLMVPAQFPLLPNTLNVPLTTYSASTLSHSSR